MTYTGYELLAFFFVYAFLGWILEIVYAAIHQKKFSNRGFLSGPLCPVYGGSMVFVLVFFQGLQDRLFFLFLGSLVVATLSELFTGMFLEKLMGRKSWDYSDYKYNLGGYVCLQFSLLWGAAAAAAVKLLQPGVTWLVRLIPGVVLRIAVILLVILLVCDFAVSAGTSLRIKHADRRMRKVAADLDRAAGRMGNAITSLVQRRMLRAYPNLGRGGAAAGEAEDASGTDSIAAGEAAGAKTKIFARGCGFHKLVWLFMIGSFLGDVTETIFCRVTAGVWMSRSSVVYGAFSIVWGLGIVMLTLILHRYKDRDSGFIFVFGTVIGGAYEYVCSVFTELVFGTVFWDYSGIPFNLGGRINLLYCFFWGIAALVWLKICYPFLSGLIEKVPVKFGTALTWIFVVFMAVNMLVSAAALARYSERAAGEPAGSDLECLLDERFDDERMERIYPNAKMTGGESPMDE